MICNILLPQLREREMEHFHVALLRFIGSSGKNCNLLTSGATGRAGRKGKKRERGWQGHFKLLALSYARFVLDNTSATSGTVGTPLSLSPLDLLTCCLLLLVRKVLHHPSILCLLTLARELCAEGCLCPVCRHLLSPRPALQVCKGLLGSKGKLLWSRRKKERQDE